MVLNTRFTDATLPVLRNDPVLAKGSLMLYDASVAASALTSHVVPNLAYQEAKALIPAGTPESLGIRIRVGAATNATPDRHRLERTAKNGLHSITSPTLTTPLNSGVWVEAQDAIKAYMLANPAHRYYASFWNRTSRWAIANNTDNIFNVSAAGGITNFFFTYYTGGGSAPAGAWHANTGASTRGEPLPLTQTDEPSLAWAESAGLSGAIADLAAFQAAGWHAGNITPGNSGAPAGGPSRILYRLTLEDLTASGRTYAEARALDLAEFTKAFAAGGRFAGDTFTNPAVIA
jgi:hypothetical protein